MTKEPTRIEDNTGFQRVKESGRWFLSNDLVQAALNDEYRNPRLDTAMLKGIASRRERAAGNSAPVSKDEWERCWRATGNANDSPASYRSTLIVPITLVNNALSNEFIDSIRKKLTSQQMVRVDRVIFGYLCFDHESTDYFDSIADVQLGYIFADLLSVYLFTRFNFTSMSKTFESLEGKLRSQEMLQQIISIHQYQPNAQLLETDSRDNLLVPVDEGIWDRMPA